ncbi:MAG: MFS transporter [Candidatus Latescibacteria bacterium]|jgi:MFS family permease|nr:MFS transporter [Candidatus Latescibacterota bacterium]
MNPIRQNPLLFPVYLPTIVLAFSRGMIIPVLPLYARSFGISYTLVGLVLAGEGIGRLAGDVPAGFLLRRLGKKPVMLLGVSTLLVSTIALYWAQSPYEALLYRFLTGLGDALWHISRHAYLTQVTALYQRGRALSTFGGINRIGTFAGPAIGGAVGALYGLRSPFLLYGGLAVIALAVALRSIEAIDDPRDSLPGQGSSGIAGRLVTILRSHYRQLLTAGLGQLFGQMIRAGRPIIVPLFAADMLGLDLLAIGSIVSIAAFVDMSLFYVAGMIMDRLGRKYAIVPCFLVQGIGMALIPFTGSYTGLLLATCLMGLGNGLGAGSMMTLGADLAPGESVGEFLGVWRLVGDGGSLGAPLVVGNVADALGLSAATWAVAGVGVLASLTFAFLVPETLRRGRDHPEEGQDTT